MFIGCVFTPSMNHKVSISKKMQTKKVKKKAEHKLGL